MNFANLPAAWVAAGVAGLAGLLYLLQRLRIRHRPVTVVTTLFWKVAAEQAPARTLVERFRHPWAYALILLISSLLWLAFSGPVPRPSQSGDFHVLVLDGSAGMAAGTRFADAVGALERYADAIPADSRQVLWSGGAARTLLNPDENDLLLKKRLEGLKPEAAPSGMDALLRQLASSGRPGRTTDVVIFGDAPVSRESLALTPGIRVFRAPIGTRSDAPNAGVTSLGIADAASGAWDRVDVYVQVDGSSKTPVSPENLRIDLDGRPIPAADLAPVTPSSAGASAGRQQQAWLLSNLPAAGGLLTVRLSADDALSLDNVASVRLPDKPRIKVQLSPSLDRALRPVLEADPAVQLTDAGASVVVRMAGEAVGAGLPALEFTKSDGTNTAFEIVHPANLDPAVVLKEAVQAIGLREIDSMSLAQSMQRPISVSVDTGPQWRFEVWEDLLSGDYDFVQSRSFPLFIASSIRWLAGARGGYPYVAAGRPLGGEALASGDRPLGSRGAAIDTLGVPYVPETAGELRVENEAHPLAVSLLDPASTEVSVSRLPAPPAQGLAGLAARPAAWLLFGALALLILEWYLHQTGRVP